MLLKELAVKNFGNIKSAKIDLDYQGITFILGKNKDAGPAATNGAGKSQFWSAIPEIAYDEPPSGRDGHKHKNSKIRLSFQDNSDNELKFIRETTGSGAKKFTVFENDKNIEIRGKAYAEAKLQKFLGSSEDDFYTKLYVDSLKVHPLIVGSAAQRQEFFVRMFNLENIDNVRKLLQAELNAVQKVAASYREVRALFESARNELKTTPEEREALTKKIERLRLERDELLSRMQKMQRIRDLISFGRDNESVIAKFHKVSSLDSFETDKQEAQSSRRKLKARLQLAQEWKAYRKQHAKYKAEASDLERQLEKLVGEADHGRIKDLAKSHSVACVRADGLRTQIRDLERDDRKVGPEPERPKDSADVYRQRVVELKHEFRHAKGFKTGKCPTCGSRVKARDIEDIKADYAKALIKMRKAEDYARWLERSTQSKKVQAKLAPLTEELAKLDKSITKYAPYEKAAKLLEDLPSKPTKPEGEEVADAGLEDKLEKLSERLAFFDMVEPLLPQIKKLSDLTPEQIKRSEAFDSISSSLTEINTRLTKLEAYKVQQDEAVRQLARMKDRAIELKEAAADEPILKELVTAYSNKGIKKMMIQRCALMLQRQVNKFVRFVFSEDFTFEFKYDTKLDVLVHRKYNKTVKTSDVKRLSGAEKRLFTLLLVVARYTLTPKNQRTNLLILDEMEANMGPEAIQNFLKALPVLNKIIPHIVVITPNPTLHVDGARFFTAVKKRGVTSLLEGKH